MSDEIDQAKELEERLIALAIEKQKEQSKASVLLPIGKCYFCETEFNLKDPLEKEKRFCDEDCRDDWQDRMKKLRIRGKN